MFVYMYVFIYEEVPDMILKSLRELRRHQTPWQINYYRTVMWQTFEKICSFFAPPKRPKRLKH